MTFHIQLRNMGDLHSYVGLFELFRFSAYVKGESFLLEAYDILSLFSYCPQENLELVLMEYSSEDIMEMGEYLRRMNLLAVAND